MYVVPVCELGVVTWNVFAAIAIQAIPFPQTQKIFHYA